MKCTYVLRYKGPDVIAAENRFDADDEWEALTLADRILDRVPFNPESITLTTPDGVVHDRIVKVWSKRPARR